MILQDNTDVAEVLRRSQTALALVKASTPEAVDSFSPVEEVWPLVCGLPLDSPDIKEIRARLLYYLAFSELRKGMFDNAIAHASESVLIFEELGLAIQRISSANALGLSYVNKGSYAEALEIFLANMEWAKRVKNRTLLGQICKNIGRVHWYLGNPSEAIEYARQSLAIAQTVPNHKALSAAYMNIGNMHASIDELAQALEYYIRGLEISEKYHADYQNMIAQFHMNIGGVFLRMGDVDRAMEYYLRSLAIHEKLGRPVEIARLYSNIGELHKERREYTAACDYFRRADAIYDRLRLPHEKAYTLALLSGVVLLMGEPDPALHYGMESMALALDGNHKRTVVLAYHAVARVYIYKEDYTQALQYLQEAKEQYIALGSTLGEVEVLVDMAIAYARQQQTEIAIDNLLTAQALVCEKNVEKPVAAKVQQMLAETYEQAGNDKQALAYFKSFRDLEKEIFTEKSEYKVQTLRILHQVEEAQKEAEIHRLRNEQLQSDMEHLQHDLVVRALHLAQRQSLLYKTKRELAVLSRGVLQNVYEEVRSAERIADKALAKKDTEQAEGKRETLHKVRQSLAAINVDMRTRLFSDVNAILQNLDNALTDETLWEQFAHQYRQVHGKFLDTLSAAFPRLSATELKVCALIHINMSSKEIGRILNIASRSVDTYRYNIRQKMELPSEANLAQYMAELAQKNK